MEKRLWIIIGLAIVVILSIVIGYSMIFHNQKTQVCFQDVCFNVEVAKNRFAIARGLMFRKNLGDRDGMLFVFKSESQHSFWMKNTFIPLDIIFLDKDKKVVDVKKNAQPCAGGKCEGYRNEKPAQYVLEVKAGTIEQIGLPLGSELSF